MVAAKQLWSCDKIYYEFISHLRMGYYDIFEQMNYQISHSAQIFFNIKAINLCSTIKCFREFSVLEIVLNKKNNSDVTVNNIPNRFNIKELVYLR